MNLSVFSSWMCGMVTGAAAVLLVRKVFFKREKEPIQCLFFSPREMNVSCRTKSCEKLACPLCNFGELCNLLKATKSQLDVCVYLITEQELSNIVVMLNKNGVNVRLIMDKQMTEDAMKCKSGLFMKHKVPMKHMQANGMMHNKFFIIDQKIVVTGSSNWTQHGFMCNYENLVIVKSKRMAKLYSQYFDMLWLDDNAK